MVRKYIKGKDGRVEVGATELEVLDWQSSGEVDTEDFSSSILGGFKASVEGNAQRSGTVKGKISEEQILDTLLKEGDHVALKLYLTKTTPSTNKKIYLDCPDVLINSVEYASDPNGGGAASFSFAFKTHGPYDFKVEDA